MQLKIRCRYRLTAAQATPAGRVVEAATLTGDSQVGRDGPRHYPHRALVLLVGGAGFYRDTTGIAQDLSIGDLLFVEPATGHAYGPRPGGRWKEVYVAYEGPVFDALAFSGMPSQSRPILHLADTAGWRSRLERAFPFSERSAQMIDAGEQIGSLVAFIIAAHLAAKNAQESQDPWLARARQLLSAPGPNALGLDAVAKACGLGVESFRKRFKSLAGESPGRFRLLARIDQAKRLLRDRDVPIRVVAESTAFCDEFHFSKTFKQVVGASPREWRTRLLHNSPRPDAPNSGSRW